MTEYHSGIMSGHFSGVRLYNTLCKRWYWEGLYTDCLNHGKTCPQCAVSKGTSQRTVPSLKPIPVSRIFQIVGVDIMELPKTTSGNRYVVVFQDFLSKWPMVFPVADQKAITLVRLLVEEVIPFMGVPEALLSDQGTNLLSTLMLDVCEKLEIKKFNTTAYHPQCNGLVEINRTLKTKETGCNLWNTMGQVYIRCFVGVQEHTTRGHRGETFVSCARYRLSHTYRGSTPSTSTIRVN